jgi:O-antigen biosynthesis protein
MSKVALVSHDVPTVHGRAGGAGTFITQFAALLRSRGEEVTIILTRQEVEPTPIDEIWRRKYASRGIRLIELHSEPPRPDRWSDAWPARLSEQVAPLLHDFDIAYFQDWANVAFCAARAKRFNPSRWPVLVTVLHGPSNWIRPANQQYPNIPEDLHVEFVERYSARHSDYVAAPSRFIVNWARREGWTFSAEPEVLGLPYLPPPDPPSPDGAAIFRQIVFFGRLETCKGFALFTQALRRVGQSLAGLERIVLLGPQHEPGAVNHIQRELGDLPVLHIGDLDSDGAASYLRSHRHDSLVVMSSPLENFPYAVIETSLIPGLNTLCSSGGGAPEIFAGAGTARFFDPHPQALAEKLLDRWHAPCADLATYDYVAANQRWLKFHDSAIHRRATPVSVAITDAGLVDVCVTYFNKSTHFPQLLEALIEQTVTGFGVIAVDDGSTDSEAREVFDSMAAKYANPGWTFFRQTNMFVDAARNQAAKHSSAEFLLFIDADDFPAPNTVERMLSAALVSGEDCLVCGGILVEGESVRAHYMPLGPNLTGGLVDPIVFGPPMILIRRTVFESIGGYREVRGAAHEDWELQVRLLLAGYRTDVVPEFLLYFRRLADGLASTSVEFLAKRRLVDTYEEHFARIGFYGVANTMLALQKRCQELEKAAREQVPPDLQRLQDRVRKMLLQKRQRS